MGRNTKILLGIFAVLVSVAAAYSNSFSGVFVYDDFINIINNTDIREFSSAVSGTSRPLTNLTFYLQYRLGLVRAADFHLINFVLHLINAVLVWIILWAISGAAGFRMRIMFSTLGSMIWATHPVQTESVTYIVQRAELLSSVFLFTALLAGVAYLSGSRKMWAAVTPVFLLLAYAGKPTAVCAPVLLLVLDSVFYSAGPGQALARHWKFYVASLATLIFPAFLLTGSHESVTSAGFSMNLVAPFEYLAFQPRAIALYLCKYIWPHRLLIDYGYDIERSVMPVIFFLIVLVLITLSAWRAGGMVRAGVCWFYAAMMPVMIVPLADLFAEHRLYLSSLGPAIIIAYGVSSGFQKLADSRRGRTLGFCSLIVGSVICVMGFRTWFRNADYADAGVLWQQVVDARPFNVRGYLGVGAEMARKRRGQEAEQVFRQGIDIYKQLKSGFPKESFRTDYAYICMNMAGILKNRGEILESTAFEKEARSMVKEFR